jgi:hypothetical protein
MRQNRCILIIFGLLLELMAVECFPPIHPTFIPNPSVGPQDAEWLTVISNAAGDTLYLGGY